MHYCSFNIYSVVALYYKANIFTSLFPLVLQFYDHICLLFVYFRTYNYIFFLLTLVVLYFSIQILFIIIIIMIMIMIIIIIIIIITIICLFVCFELFVIRRLKRKIQNIDQRCDITGGVWSHTPNNFCDVSFISLWY